MINGYFIVAGILAAVSTGVHVMAGGKEIIRPLFASSLERSVILVSYACWHIVTAVLALSAMGLLAYGMGWVGDRGLVGFVSTMWVAFGVIFIVVSGMDRRPGALLRYPQWMLLTPVGLTGWAGVVLTGT
jgi:hypothetical protein